MRLAHTFPTFILVLLLTLSSAQAQGDTSEKIQQCGEQCNEAFYPCHSGCLETSLYCFQGCAPIDDYVMRTACEDECTEEYEVCDNQCKDAYNSCMKACMIGTGIPQRCIDVYDMRNLQPYLDCGMSLISGIDVPNYNPENQSSVCGDGLCESDETSSCPYDCYEPVCGNEVCEANETWTCPDDCITPVCGNHECEPPTENMQNCREDCLENCTDGIENDLDTLADCNDLDCKSDPTCKPVYGRVTFIDVEGPRPIRNAQMFVRWKDILTAVHEKPFYSDDNGEYSILAHELFLPNAKEPTLVVRFTENQVRVRVTEAGIDTEALQSINLSDVKAGKPQNIVIGAPAGGASGNTPHARENAKAYFHTKEAVDFISDILFRNHQYQFLLLGWETVRTFEPPSDAGAYHSTHDAEGNGFIALEINASKYDSMEAPTNCEYHEYGHHIMNSIFVTMPPWHQYRNGTYADNNHDGYINHCSSDSWLEGFAEFMSLATNVDSGVQKRCAVPAGQFPYIYCVGNTQYDFERNFQANNWEEAAVAGILWDVYDSAAINNDGSPDDDYVSVDFERLWDILSAERDFPNYYTGDVSPRHIWYVKDLFLALKEEGVGQKDSNGNGVSDLSEIFKSHGFYYHDATTNTDVYGELMDAAGHVRR